MNNEKYQLYELAFSSACYLSVCIPVEIHVIKSQGSLLCQERQLNGVILWMAIRGTVSQKV